MNENTNNESKPALTADINGEPALMQKKNGHGGARKGAGRPCKDGPKERVSASVKIGTANALKDEALARGISISRLIARKLEAAQPYDPNLPDMPPLIDDIVMSEEGWRRFNAEAEEVGKVAKEIGFHNYRDAIDRLFERPSKPAKKKRPPHAKL